MNISLMQYRSRLLAAWALAGLGLMLPISPAGSNIMSFLLILGWLGCGAWSDKLTRLRQSPAALGAGVFLLLVVIGLAYGEGNDGLHYLTKYASLLLLPIILSLPLTSDEKQRAIGAFCAAMVLTLVLSLLIWVELMPSDVFKGSSPDNPIVFKLHITQGFFMILAAYFMYVAALRMSICKSRWLLLGLALLAVINALLIIKGRTGQVVFCALLIYLFHLRFPRYGLLFGLAFSIVIGVTAYGISPAFKERADVAATELQQWQGRRGDPNSSIGLRLDYYSNTLAIFREHVLFGVGTSGFARAYDKQVAGTAMQPSNNPHNQYLLITAQYGLIGLAVLCFMYFCLWRQARQQEEPWHRLACGLLLAYLVGNLFNSFMLDLSERLMFVWGMGLLLAVRPSKSVGP